MYNLKAYAKNLGLDGSFDICLDERKYKSQVDEDVQQRIHDGVQGTLTFFINGKIVVGDDLNKFQQMINAELA